MLITNSFVLLNFPKTGSSFAREMIKTVYRHRESGIRRFLMNAGIIKPDILEIMMPKIDETIHYDIVDQHGTFRQIPPEHRKKSIVSIARNPFSWYVSNYFYRWWADYPQTDIQIIRRAFPSFPDLSFAEFYEMDNDFSKGNRLRNINLSSELGSMTIQFIQSFAKEPESLLPAVNDRYIMTGKYKEDFSHIHFLRQEKLEAGLISFLAGMGFRMKDLRFIENMPRINETICTGYGDKDYRKFVPEPVGRKILERDRLLFSMFPEYVT